MTYVDCSQIKQGDYIRIRHKKLGHVVAEGTFASIGLYYMYFNPVYCSRDTHGFRIPSEMLYVTKVYKGESQYA